MSLHSNLPPISNRYLQHKLRILILLLLILAILYRILYYYSASGELEAPVIRRTLDPIFQLLHYQYEDFRFNLSNNETGFNELIVPDIVHYIQLETPYLEFITLISIMSVVRHHKPRLIMIHTDRKHLRGKYWDQVAQLNSSQTVILLNRIKRPIYIFDVKLSSVYHASDIVRIRTLRKYGGIYLDNDVYVIKPLHQFRRFELTLGWPENQFMGTQVIIAHRNARFLKLWYESYRHYRPSMWYFNAGELPTTSFLERSPDLVHRVKTEFGVHNLIEMLYNDLDSSWQQDYFTVHLLARHRSYMATDGIKYFNEHNINDYNRTFGQMARLAYFGHKNPRS